MKTHKDENFPVASYVIQRKHRRAILDFYYFARAADDVADDPALSEQEKLLRLDQFEATLPGNSDAIASPRHALDLLTAFRQDVHKQRYKNWDELMQYCALSAAPVGRFVLDVHGENPSVWPASDALCSALQIINHLQDCSCDYTRLNRVYLPLDTMERHNVSDVDLAAPHASEGLRQCIRELASETQKLMATVPLSAQIQDNRLSLEVAIIERIAHKLLGLLQTRDPLSERVHLHKVQLIPLMAQAMFTTLAARVFTRIPMEGKHDRATSSI